MQINFVLMREYSIGKQLVEGYLHQPYSWFLSRHSADIGKTILSEVAAVIGNGIKPLMEIIARGMVVITLITLLILIVILPVGKLVALASVNDVASAPIPVDSVVLISEDTPVSLTLLDV